MADSQAEVGRGSSASLPDAPVRRSSGRVRPGFRVGQQVGPYTLCMELASGGMATVFLARTAATTGRPSLVALKIVHPHLASTPEFVDMFSDEARIGSLLRHPNVCEVFEFDEADGAHYLAMEYLNGEPLSMVFRRTARRTGRLDQHAALIVRVAADACAGLHAAHGLKGPDGKALNLVHRDVSPENLFVTYAGVTKLVDFGLAGTDVQTHRTRAGVIKGKFAYVSPEALAGLRADRRTDVWSLGVVVWEVLTGRRLFHRATDLETLAAVAEAPIPSPSSVRPGLPRELDEPVLRALSRDASQRQRSAKQLGEELIRALPRASQITQAQVAGWISQLFPDERRWKARVIELIEVFSNDAYIVPEPEVELLTGAGAPGRPPARARRAPARTPRGGWASRAWGRRSLASAAAVATLAGAVVLARSLLGAEIEDQRSVETLAADEPRSGASEAAPATVMAPPAFERGPEPSQQEGDERRVELPKGDRYLLEVAESPDGKPTLILRLKPAPAGGGSAAGVSPVLRSETDPSPEPPVPEASPPTWLVEHMRRDPQRFWAAVRTAWGARNGDSGFSTAAPELPRPECCARTAPRATLFAHLEHRGGRRTRGLGCCPSGDRRML